MSSSKPYLKIQSRLSHFFRQHFKKVSPVAHQTSFLILFWTQTITEKRSNFDSKPWAYPFGKIQYDHPQNYPPNKRSFRSTPPSKTSSSIFTYSILTRKNQKETFQFWLKSWVNTFGKIQYPNEMKMKMKIVINALFGLFSRLKHRQTSFLILFWQKSIKKKLSNFDRQNYELTPVEKSNMTWKSLLYTLFSVFLAV